MCEKKKVKGDGRMINSLWLKNMIAISDFFKTYKHYPKAGGDVFERRLYQSLYKTRVAKSEDRLSQQQLDIIKDLNIDI